MKRERDIRRDIRWGIRWGLGGTVFFGAWVTIVRILSGTDAFDELGTTYPAIVLAYLACGLVSGVLLGMLRPYTRTVGGAAMVGWLLAFAVYTGVSIAIGNPPWRWHWFMLMAIGLASLVVGVVGGVTHWRRYYK